MLVMNHTTGTKPVRIASSTRASHMVCPHCRNMHTTCYNFHPKHHPSIESSLHNTSRKYVFMQILSTEIQSCQYCTCRENGDKMCRKSPLKRRTELYVNIRNTIIVHLKSATRPSLKTIPGWLTWDTSSERENTVNVSRDLCTIRATRCGEAILVCILPCLDFTSC